MTFASRFNFSPLSLTRRAVGAVALFGLLAMPAVAQDDEADKEEPKAVTIRAAASDSINISGSGQVTLSLTRAPATSSGAKLLVVNSENYALWSGDLSRSGGSWSAKLDREAVEALLVANAVQAEFPGAATGGKDLRLSFVRDVFQPALGPTAALVGSEPLFYDAPEKPEPLEAIGSNTEASHVESWAMAARRYDEQLAAYHYQLVAAKATAQALWVDLKTAGRLPEAWPASLIKAQDAAFAALDKVEAAVAKEREAARASAKATIDQWNSAHAGDDVDEVMLPFREISE